MRSETLNPIDYVNRAIEVGFTREQAEFQVKHEMNILDSLVTKKYFTEQLSNEIKLFEQRLTIKLGIMMVSVVGILAFLLKH